MALTFLMFFSGKRAQRPALDLSFQAVALRACNSLALESELHPSQRQPERRHGRPSLTGVDPLALELRSLDQTLSDQPERP